MTIIFFFSNFPNIDFSFLFYYFFYFLCKFFSFFHFFHKIKKTQNVVLANLLNIFQARPNLVVIQSICIKQIYLGKKYSDTQVALILPGLYCNHLNGISFLIVKKQFFADFFKIYSFKLNRNTSSLE